jgi:TonB-dependent receptor
MATPKTKQRLISVAVASACMALAATGHAQEQAQAQAQAQQLAQQSAPEAASAKEAKAAPTLAEQAAKQAEPATTTSAPTGPDGIQRVVVQGLRNSLSTSLNLKRRSDGIVDGIVAADIGKFPDTNLAESLQRITGVSIDRSIGEGSKVTVRGVGPDFNMVLLNGRQMPVSNLGDTNGRAFDFANIASEAISQIQVYKTSRAETPTGGIGATLNVMTARPFDNPGLHSSIGLKVLNDTSNNNLPGDVKANTSTTPEFSGLYSNTSNDGRFGVAVSGSYQERNLGFNSASVPNGWRSFQGDDSNSWGRIPLPNEPGAQNITNRPAATDVYSIPQNLVYGLSGVKRQRTNGQLAFQFKPTSDLTTTLDYTYAENKIQTKRAELSSWFNFGPSRSVFSNGPVAAPLIYTEFLAGKDDISQAGAQYATKTQNKSLGFNAAWKATPNLKLEFDAHHSTAESGADSPYGSKNVLSTASFSRGNTTGDFTHTFPVLSIVGADFVKAPQQVTGSVFENAYQKATVNQFQVKGRLKVLEASNLNFGLSAIELENRSTFSAVQSDTWGGTTTNAADYPSTLFHAETLRKYFNRINGSNNPALFNNFNTFNFAELRALAATVTGNPKLYLPNTTSADSDRTTREKSKSAFLQLNTEWDWKWPTHTAVGVRLEKTDVVSTALVPTATAINWVSQNELPVQFTGTNFETQRGSYNNVLPSIDFDIEPHKDIKLRASYGETIGRPRYDQIQGGTTINTAFTVGGGTGAAGNPGLKPVKSKNIDLSFEWYYSKQNYLSVGLFHKDLDNYVGQTAKTVTSTTLHTPVGGAYWNEALAAGCIVTDTTCIREFIFRNHNGAPGVNRGVDSKGNPIAVITGQPGDPLATFRIDSFANQRSASLKGLEFNVQHLFGNGFGVIANYTVVRSGLKYDNTRLNDQFALLGLSDSANLVGIYEDKKWTIRAAYNWRDEFLSSTNDGSGNNPAYTEPYGQLDLSVGYAYNDKLSFQFEAINLTDKIQRIHGRTKSEVLSVTQSGPRYSVGLRYKF